MLLKKETKQTQPDSLRHRLLVPVRVPPIGVNRSVRVPSIGVNRSVRVPSIGQIDLLKNDSYLIG